MQDDVSVQLALNTIRKEARKTRSTFGGGLIRPKIAIIAGSGLRELTTEVENKKTFDFDEILGYKNIRGSDHPGKLILGTLEDTPVAIMDGRYHFYEGFTPQQITTPIRVLRRLGARTLILTCACGGLLPHHRKGEIAVIRDHINLMGSPLVGPNNSKYGPRFPDMYQVYDYKLASMAASLLPEYGHLQDYNIYAGVVGPQLETPAEYAMLRTLGATLVGMSIVPEAITAVHCGMKVLGLGVITDLCDPTLLKPTKISEIIEAANAAEPQLRSLLKEMVKSQKYVKRK
jgi:purine-nucleoside phosphorylase